MEQKVLVSLFDWTGFAVADFTASGRWKTVIVDLQHSPENRLSHPRAAWALNWNVIQHLDDIIGLNPSLVFGMPPCTDLAVSGARWWAAKRAANPKFQEEAVALARTVETIGEACGCPWWCENPIGAMSRLWRKPDVIFQPYEFGGYLPIDDVHPEHPRYIAPRDAYPKLTCLWTGNGFVLPPKKPVAPEPGYSRQFKMTGGKSLDTKNIRSATPRGFARALFETYGS